MGSRLQHPGHSDTHSLTSPPPKLPASHHKIDAHPRRIATGLGTIAVIAGLTGLITGSAHALEILVVVTVPWLGTAIFWHVLTIGSEW